MPNETSPQRSPLELLETTTKILANVGGLFIPIAVAYLAWALNVANANRQDSAQTAETLLSHEDAFIQISDERRAALIRALQASGSSAAIIKAVLAAGAANPSLKADVQTVVAQGFTPAAIAETAKSSDPAVRLEAQQVLDAKYMVVIASSPNQTSAEAEAQSANTRFRNAQSDLHAVALPPGNTPFWGVYVGNGVALGDARSIVQKARRQDYKDAYIIRAPS